MLYTLKFHNVMCQVHLNNAGKKFLSSQWTERNEKLIKDKKAELHTKQFSMRIT